jgi:hypothetical protein
VFSDPRGDRKQRIIPIRNLPFANWFDWIVVDLFDFVIMFGIREVELFGQALLSDHGAVLMP